MTELQRVDATEHLRALLDEKNQIGVEDYLSKISGFEGMRELYHLRADEQITLLELLDPQIAADLIVELPEEFVADLLERLPSERATQIVTALPSNGQADILKEVEPSARKIILANIQPLRAKSIEELISYDDDSAGGLMVREFLSYTQDSTTRIVLEDLTSGRLTPSKYSFQQCYVVSNTNLILGTVRLKTLIGTSPEEPLINHLEPPSLINIHADLETISICFDETNLETLPVADDRGDLKGVLRRDDVDRALVDKATEDHMKSQGILGGEELRSLPTKERSRKRLSWLSINILLNIIAASVIAFFEETLTAVIALAVFLPIVSDMSGCSGNQAVAVSMRELTLGIVDARDTLKVWWQEVKVGLINGLVLGVLLGAASYLWKGNPYLGLVVGSALAINTVIAVSLGGTVPLLLKKLKADPAVASGPILTTVTDMCGFFLVLGIATLALPLLTG